MVNIDDVLFRNPIIIASCPLTESVQNIEKCIDRGAGGIILKTAADYQRKQVASPRKIVHARNGYWAQSTFEREIMTLEEAVRITKAVNRHESVPIIPSVAADELESTHWLTACKRLEDAGASMLQLDFFYLNNLWEDREFAVKLLDLLERLQQNCSVPIVPKINVNLPQDFIFPIIKKANIKTVSLLDSVRVPVIPKWFHEGEENRCNVTNEGTSFFGSWQMPLTLSYVMSAKNYGLNIIGGGGIRNREDVEIMFYCGVAAVQIASAAMFGKYDVIKELVRN